MKHSVRLAARFQSVQDTELHCKVEMISRWLGSPVVRSLASPLLGVPVFTTAAIIGRGSLIFELIIIHSAAAIQHTMITILN